MTAMQSFIVCLYACLTVCLSVCLTIWLSVHLLWHSFDGSCCEAETKRLQRTYFVGEPCFVKNIGLDRMACFANRLFLSIVCTVFKPALSYTVQPVTRTTKQTLQLIGYRDPFAFVTLPYLSSLWFFFIFPAVERLPAEVGFEWLRRNQRHSDSTG